MNEITNYFLVQKYKKKIENIEKKKYFLKKMPKIIIKNIDEKNEVIDTNIFESNNSRTDSYEQKKLEKYYAFTSIPDMVSTKFF